MDSPAVFQVSDQSDSQSIDGAYLFSDGENVK